MVITKESYEFFSEYFQKQLADIDYKLKCGRREINRLAEQQRALKKTRSAIYVALNTYDKKLCK